jgi:hypothetical protein
LQREEQGRCHFGLQLIPDVRWQEKVMSAGKFVKSVFALALVASVAVAQDLEDARQRLAEAISRGTSNAELFETNGFRVESSGARELGRDLEPSGPQFQLISISADDMFRVSIERGRPGMSLGGGIGVFDGKTGVPIISFGDRDGDGRIDILDYLVLDENGERALSVTDYEFDGQPDLRIHYKESFFEIWHIDQWYRVTKQGEQSGIFIDGEFVALRQENNRWIVP